MMASLPEGLPATIRVGSVDYTVVPLTYVDVVDRNVHGQHSQTGKELRVYFDDRPVSFTAEVLLHEICTRLLGSVAVGEGG